MFVLFSKYRNLINRRRRRNLYLDMNRLNIGVEIRLCEQEFLASVGLWATPIIITTGNRVSMYFCSICCFPLICRGMWYQINLCCFMNCCAYRSVFVMMWSIVCSIMYSLKKTYAAGFPSRGTSILFSLVSFIFLGLNRCPGYIAFYCKEQIIDWLHLGPYYL